MQCVEITQWQFNLKGIKLKVNTERRTIPNMWKLNHIILSNLWVKEEFTGEIGEYLFFS